MSFEGYYQILCRNGHNSGDNNVYDGPNFNGPEVSEYDGPDGTVKYDTPRWKCICGELAGWWNIVDETNCEAYGFVKFEEVTPLEYKTCDMGHQHITKESTHRPPTESDFGHLVNGGLNQEQS